MKLIKLALFQLSLVLSTSAYGLSDQARGLLQEFLSCAQNSNYSCVVDKAEYLLSLNNADLDKNQDSTVRFYLRNAYFYLADKLSNPPTSQEIKLVRKYSERGLELGRYLIGSKFAERKTFTIQEISFNAKLAIAQHESGEMVASKNTAKHLKQLLRTYVPGNDQGDQELVRWAKMVADTIL